MAQPHHHNAGPPAGPPSAGTGAGATKVARLQQSDLFREYRRAFEASTGLPLVLREPGSFRTPLQGSRRVNPFCALVMQSNRACAACLQLQQRLEEEATLEPKTRQCYAGLSETAVPVRVGDKVFGYLQTGQVFLRAPSTQQFKSVTRVMQGEKIGAGPRQLESAYFQTRVLTRKQYESTIRLLAIFAQHLAAVCNEILLRETVIEPPMITRGRTFIVEHSGEVLRLRDVAHAVNMSPFYFCKVFKHSTGYTFTEYLARVRTESVKQRLLNVQTRVSEAAYAAGFQSLSQFNRVFHRIVGEAPGRYRDRIHCLNGRVPRNANFICAA